MAKDPAFLFYPNDYLGGTMGFSFEMHGAYLIMLLYQFNNGPFSDDVAVSVVGNNWKNIQHKFKRKTGSGLRYSEKMESVIKQRKNFLTSRRESAMKRWGKTDKPLSNKKINTMHTQCIRNAHAMRMGNGNGNGNKDENKRKNYAFIPPTFEEVKNYCAEKGYSKIAQKVFDYYSEANWHDSTGKKIKNWKQKLIAVWFRDENKDPIIPKNEYQQKLVPKEEQATPEDMKVVSETVSSLTKKFSIEGE